MQPQASGGHKLPGGISMSATLRVEDFYRLGLTYSVGWGKGIKVNGQNEIGRDENRDRLERRVRNYFPGNNPNAQ